MRKRYVLPTVYVGFQFCSVVAVFLFAHIMLAPTDDFVPDEVSGSSDTATESCHPINTPGYFGPGSSGLC